MTLNNKRLNALMRKKKRLLIDQARALGHSFSYSNSTRREIAEYILEMQDHKDQEDQGDDQADQSDFEQLTETDEPIIEESRGGPRPGAGRPEGQTELHTHVEACRAIKKSDPTVFFFVSGLFSFWAMRTNVWEIASDCDQQAESLALSITKFMRYQWPDLQLDPRLEFGAGILRELRNCFLWGKEKIDRAEVKPVDEPVIHTEDVSEEVFEENNNEPGD